MADGSANVWRISNVFAYVHRSLTRFTWYVAAEQSYLHHINANDAQSRRRWWVISLWLVWSIRNYLRNSVVEKSASIIDWCKDDAATWWLGVDAPICFSPVEDRKCGPVIFVVVVVGFIFTHTIYVHYYSDGNAIYSMHQTMIYGDCIYNAYSIVYYCKLLNYASSIWQ